MDASLPTRDGAASGADAVEPAAPDWYQVLDRLAGRSGKPMVLLDGRGLIRACSSYLEKTLGWSRYEIEGRRWSDLCVPAQGDCPMDQGPGWVGGEARSQAECRVRTRDGSHVTLRLDTEAIGHAATHGLLLTVRSVESGDTPEVLDATDLDYEISAGPSDFGVLQRLRRVGSTHSNFTGGGKRCFEVLHARNTPCAHCPVLRGATEPWPRTAVRRSSARPETFELMRADVVDPTTVRLRVRMVTDDMARALHEAKIREMADEAKLSTRERDVLTYLMMGRSLRDIATILSITERTVKFHQANVLEKIGADSRVDLMRLIY